MRSDGFVFPVLFAYAVFNYKYNNVRGMFVVLRRKVCVDVVLKSDMPKVR